jgi:hypothetical protein
VACEKGGGVVENSNLLRAINREPASFFSCDTYAFDSVDSIQQKSKERVLHRFIHPWASSVSSNKRELPSFNLQPS